MSDWYFGSSDQYIVDTESRYPEFSDVQTNDYSISLYHPKYVNTLEDKYQVEQQYRPAYYTCPPRRSQRRSNIRGPSDGPRCPMAAGATPSPRPALPTQTIDEREKNKYIPSSWAGGESAAGDKETFLSCLPAATTCISPAVFTIFLFIIAIIICYLCATIANINTQLRLMEQLIRK